MPLPTSSFLTEWGKKSDLQIHHSEALFKSGLYTTKENSLEPLA